jgi:hypothetical protein
LAALYRILFVKECAAENNTREGKTVTVMVIIVLVW